MDINALPSRQLAEGIQQGLDIFVVQGLSGRFLEK